MVRTDEFAKDMKKELEQLRPEIAWHCSWCLEGGDQNEHTDLGGERKPTGQLVLIEVELRRKNPVGNVAKVWRWFEDKRLGPSCVLFQAFSRFYKEHASHRENARFIGKKLESETGVGYQWLDFPYNPRAMGKVGAGARRKQAIRLARRISRRLKKAGDPVAVTDVHLD